MDRISIIFMDKQCVNFLMASICFLQADMITEFRVAF